MAITERTKLNVSLFGVMAAIPTMLATIFWVAWSLSAKSAEIDDTKRTVDKAVTAAEKNGDNVTEIVVQQKVQAVNIAALLKQQDETREELRRQADRQDQTLRAILEELRKK